MHEHFNSRTSVVWSALLAAAKFLRIYICITLVPPTCNIKLVTLTMEGRPLMYDVRFRWEGHIHYALLALGDEDD